MAPSRLGALIAAAAIMLTAAMDPSKDYYSILGVPKDANERTIDKAYRAAAKKWHPDRNPDGAATFVRIQEAHGVLSDAQKRREYDDLRRYGGQPRHGGGGGYQRQQHGGGATFMYQFQGPDGRIYTRYGAPPPGFGGGGGGGDPWSAFFGGGGGGGQGGFRQEVTQMGVLQFLLSVALEVLTSPFAFLIIIMLLTVCCNQRREPEEARRQRRQPGEEGEADGADGAQQDDDAAGRADGRGGARDVRDGVQYERPQTGAGAMPVRQRKAAAAAADGRDSAPIAADAGGVRVPAVLRRRAAAAAAADAAAAASAGRDGGHGQCNDDLGSAGVGAIVPGGLPYATAADMVKAALLPSSFVPLLTLPQLTPGGAADASAAPAARASVFVVAVLPDAPFDAPGDGDSGGAGAASGVADRAAWRLSPSAAAACELLRRVLDAAGVTSQPQQRGQLCWAAEWSGAAGMHTGVQRPRWARAESNWAKRLRRAAQKAVDRAAAARAAAGDGDAESVEPAAPLIDWRQCVALAAVQVDVSVDTVRAAVQILPLPQAGVDDLEEIVGHGAGWLASVAEGAVPLRDHTQLLQPLLHQAP